MTQWLRVLPALAEDSISTSIVGGLQLLIIPAPRDPVPSFGLHGYLYA